jgi:hypothetical protein
MKDSFQIVTIHVYLKHVVFETNDELYGVQGMAKFILNKL